MRETLDRLIDDFQDRELPALCPRDRTLPRMAGKADVVIGMRRTGKTWFCYQQIEELLAGGVPKRRFLYVNFEDERLLPFSASDFQTLLDAYFRKVPESREEGAWLFLDEVQRIEGWDRFVRRVLDTERLTVVVTGSSSKLLATEIATSLRGRSLTTEIFPFSFGEFLRFHEVDPSPPSLGSRTRSVLEKMVDRYLFTGGFPEVLPLEPDLRRRVLTSYVDVAILRDVVERHGVSNVTALRAMLRHLMSAPANRFSVNRFYGSLRSQGISVTKNALYEYVDHLTDAYLMFAVPLHTRSEAARRVNPSKMYAVDTGLLDAMAIPMTKDLGARLENLVFLHLRRKGLRPTYHLTASGAEVDFVLSSRPGAAPDLVQACWNLTDESTRNRETTAIREAKEELGAASATIVTWLDPEGEADGIRIVPAWKWLLDR